MARPKLTDEPIKIGDTPTDILKFYLSKSETGRFFWETLDRQKWISIIFSAKEVVAEDLWEKAFNTISQ